MQVEDWAEFIKNVLSSSAFKAVAMAALRARYHKAVTLADGTHDGGVDAWIALSDRPDGRVPVQFHSGRSVDWNQKLTEDIEKPLVRDCPAKRLFFVCAQTPSPVKVKQVLADLEVSHGIVVTLLDARDLASEAHRPEVSDALGKVAMVPLTSRPPATVTAGDDARLAFIFFHEAAGDFRAEVARCALMSCLADLSPSLPVDDVIERAIRVVGGEQSLRWLFRRAFAALVTDGKASEENGSAIPSRDLVTIVTGLRAAQAPRRRNYATTA